MLKKSHFIFVSISKQILPILFCLFIFFLVIFSRENLIAAKDGLALWSSAVVPSLLPFFIATELLGHTKVISTLGKYFHRIMKPIFNVPGEGSYALLMGIISGYPMGAKIITEFREQGICTKAEGERLLAFTNNSGPLFIIGTVGISLFYDTRTGFLLFVTHIIACLLVGIIFRFWKRKEDGSSNSSPISLKPKKQFVTFSNLGDVLTTSILNSVHTIILIGGFVVLFSVLLSILEHSGFLLGCQQLLEPVFRFFKFPTDAIKPLLSGILELTNGVKQVSNLSIKSFSTNVILASFLLGFGGISVLLQVLSITSKSDISIKPYFLGKLLQSSIASILTYLALHYTPFFNLDLAPVFSPNMNHLTVLHSYYNIFTLCILGIVILLSGYLLLKRKRTAK